MFKNIQTHCQTRTYIRGIYKSHIFSEKFMTIHSYSKKKWYFTFMSLRSSIRNVEFDRNKQNLYIIYNLCSQKPSFAQSDR